MSCTCDDIGENPHCPTHGYEAVIRRLCEKIDRLEAEEARAKTQRSQQMTESELHELCANCGKHYDNHVWPFFCDQSKETIFQTSQEKAEEAEKQGLRAEIAELRQRAETAEQALVITARERDEWKELYRVANIELWDVRNRHRIDRVIDQ